MQIVLDLPDRNFAEFFTVLISSAADEHAHEFTAKRLGSVYGNEAGVGRRNGLGGRFSRGGLA